MKTMIPPQVGMRLRTLQKKENKKRKARKKKRKAKEKKRESPKK